MMKDKTQAQVRTLYYIPSRHPSEEAKAHEGVPEGFKVASYTVTNPHSGDGTLVMN